jgi:hypothetical protein
MERAEGSVRAWIKVRVRVRVIELPALYVDLISSDWVTTESLKARINLKSREVSIAV